MQHITYIYSQHGVHCRCVPNKFQEAERGEHGSGHPWASLVSEEFLVLPGDKDIDSYLDGNSDEPGVMGTGWPLVDAKCLEMS